MISIGNDGHVIFEEVIGIRINYAFYKGIHVSIEKDGFIVISSSVGNSCFSLVVDGYCCIDIGAILFYVSYHYFVVPEGGIFLVVGGLHYSQLCVADGDRGVPEHLEDVHGRGQKVGVFPVLDGVVGDGWVGFEVGRHGGDEVIDGCVGEGEGVQVAFDTIEEITITYQEIEVFEDHETFVVGDSVEELFVDAGVGHLWPDWMGGFCV